MFHQFFFSNFKLFVKKIKKKQRSKKGAKYEVRNKLPNGEESVKQTPAYSFTTAGHIRIFFQNVL